jgi:hypothetical protein
LSTKVQILFGPGVEFFLICKLMTNVNSYN